MDAIGSLNAESVECVDRGRGVMSSSHQNPREQSSPWLEPAPLLGRSSGGWSRTEGPSSPAPRESRTVQKRKRAHCEVFGYKVHSQQLGHVNGKMGPNF